MNHEYQQLQNRMQDRPGELLKIFVEKFEKVFPNISESFENTFGSHLLLLFLLVCQRSWRFPSSVSGI